MKELYQTLISRNPGDPDNENILKVKGLIRRT
jgi:glucosamine-6-phosphate deaminase